MKIAILIPTFNEAINIELLLIQISKILDTLQKDYFVIYVIDDSSPDGTGDIVIRMKSTLDTPHLKINLFNRVKKEGLGKAYQDGINKVLKDEQRFDFILQMDSDLSHNPIYIPKFLEKAANGADLIIGSRYIPNGSTPNWSWYRKALSLIGNVYARTLLDKKITDYTGGFNLISTKLLRKIELDNLDSSGYGFLIHLKYELSKHSSHLTEVPIKFIDREYGLSKMPINTIFKNFYLVLKIK